MLGSSTRANEPFESNKKNKERRTPISLWRRMGVRIFCIYLDILVACCEEVILGEHFDTKSVDERATRSTQSTTSC
jgi:hypothetical protein